MGSFVHDIIIKHCIVNNLITKDQHGCATNLLETRDILTNAISECYAIDLIYTDFAKAFDKVSHKRLLHKLKSYCVCRTLLEWIDNWQANRQQRVTIGNHKSDWKKVTSDVPQG
ncbi:uncharacterized protein LOC105850769 [Hydra vulgaris]|uniref:uncharacterized protein LOC105850769 n=1 Tax=Hydra vulgaris TaxID=6087 RepID=UPI0006414C13|nr:uncharacterized protein LOC105850769 [Hydra vulgaris]